MCGRAYITYTDDELRFRGLARQRVKIPSFSPNYNLSPTQETLVARAGKLGPILKPLKWGLVPSWAKDTKIGYKLINARAETIAEKPSFRSAFRTRRCIIPVSGFYEWKTVAGKKHPFAISFKDSPIMGLAGIWEHWESEKGTALETFSIITSDANTFMTDIHDRMPAIIRPEDDEEWLDPAHHDLEKLRKLLRPFSPKQFQAVEVSTLVNSPKHNSPRNLEPVAQQLSLLSP